jgi:hypothetical protein
MWITLVIGVVKQIIGKQSQVLDARSPYRIDESVIPEKAVMDPNDLVETLMDENPDATPQELLRLFLDAFKDDPEAQEMAIREVFEDLWKQFRLH